MSKDNLIDNEKELIAWNQWKEVCSILGCKGENRVILSNRVSGAFRDKLKRYTRGYNGPKLTEDDIAQIFDVSIIEKRDADKLEYDEVQRKIPKKPRDYKNYIWYIIENSDDPPLKIIRGKITATKGIINDIVERYVNAELSGREKKNKQTKNCQYNRHLSMEDKIHEDGTTLGDKLSSLVDKKKSLSEDDENYIKEALEVLSYQEMALLLARSKSISFDNPAVYAATSLKKSAAYDRFNKVIAPKLFEFKDIIIPIMDECTHVYDFILSLIKERLGAENSAKELLLLVESKINN